MAQAPVPDDYAAAIQYLYRRINYEQSPPIPYRRRKINLEQMKRLLDRLGNPHHRVPVIHIAGTKGKGSTAAMIGSVLTQAGYRTGLYTSPHLSCLEERYVIDGQRCQPGELAALTESVRPAAAEVDQEIQTSANSAGLTFFELTTAMAWRYFVQQQVDLAVFEAGLGGRLDSTNVCQPLVAVITSISFDHTRQLGNTLAAIAGEKAGIIKPGIPVISGVAAPEARSVIETTARQRNSPLFSLGAEFLVEPRGGHRVDDEAEAPAELDYSERIGDVRRDLDSVQVGLIGRHQSFNAGVAIAAINRLDALGWPVGEPELRRGLANVRCPARIEVVSRHPTVIVDTAHNVASIAALVDALNDRFPQKRRTLIFAASRDKDIPGMLRQLLPHFQEIVLTQFLHNPRAVQAEDLRRIALNLTTTGNWELPRGSLAVARTPHEAWEICRGRLGVNDLACIAGSFFLAAEMRPLFVPA
jgi:dihydrofolate synthase/folylpolyglutamate synthase